MSTTADNPSPAEIVATPAAPLPSLDLGKARLAGRLAWWRKRVIEVSALEPELQSLTNTQLRKLSLSLQYRARQW